MNDEWQRKSFDLIKSEYESLRAESAQARQAQQSILQWSLATIGVVMTAGVVITNATMSEDIGPHGEKFLYAVFLFWFGVGAPGAGWLSCLAWFGELVRMERAGRYLRGVEMVICDLLSNFLGNEPELAYLEAPLRWESYISTENRRALGAAKQRVGYFGSLGLYCGILALSLGIFTIRVWMDPVFWKSTHDRSLLTAYALLVLAGFVASTAFLVKALEKAGREVADVSIITPDSLRSSLRKPSM